MVSSALTEKGREGVKITYSLNVFISFILNIRHKVHKSLKVNIQTEKITRKAKKIKSIKIKHPNVKL